jgi:S-(hydroxymethyl)glutathione dehydrogenase / alcohol dehydrogenase
MTLAAVLDDGSDDLVVTDIEVDAPRGREVVVRTLATGLCHSDLHFIDGVLTRPRPVLLGHEAVGIVEAIGPGVDSVSVGDRVVTCLVVGCGRCARCEQGEPYVCADPNAVRRARGEPARMRMADGRAIAPMANIGALADRMLVDERALVKIPESMPPTLSAIVGCAVVTGVGSVFNVAKVRPSETVAVIGCGGVGLNVVQGARIAGASRVIAVDVSASKLDLARKLGATDAVDASQDDAVEVVRALVGEGVDHAFEVIGRAETARQAFEMAAPGRHAYIVGVFPDDAELQIPTLSLRRGKSLVGVFMGATRPRVDIPRYIGLWERGLLDLESMVSDVIALDGANDGFAALKRGEVARAVVSFD